MKVTVTQGDVKVSSVDVIYDLPDVKVLEVHTSHKYPVAAGFTPGYMQGIWPADWEARVDDFAVTQVEFDFNRGAENAHWWQVVDADRYRLTVVLFRYHLDHEHRTEIYNENIKENRT